jgi:hypothetical protein
MAKAVTQQSSKTNSANTTLFEKLNAYLDKHEKTLFWGLLILGIVLALMSFNARMSEAHDDSLYIEAGYRYVHEFPNYYYTSNAPMYPMFLALLTLIFGTNLIYFKLFSVLFYALGAVIFYKALDKKVTTVLKFFVYTFLCINYLVLYYASQTFSEAFYMLVQAIFFYYFTTYNFSEQPISTNLKKDWKKWLVLGFLMMTLTLAKNILLFGIVAIVLFYSVKKEWKKAVFALAFFGLFKALYELIKSIVWGKSAIQYQSQVNILLNKDPYDASQGQEDIAGFFGRFTDNIAAYVGRRFYEIIGFFNEDSMFKKVIEKDGQLMEVPNNSIYFFLAFIILGLTFIGLYKAFKTKNDIILFFLLFAGSICFGTFFVLQARWDQPRFIMVHMPALLLGILYGLYVLFTKSTNQWVFVSVMLLLCISFIMSSSKRAFKNLPIASKNIKGDIYYGYTPDWKNYLQLSAYCKDSLPESSLVAARKAPMSFVYAKGKHFYPIYSVIAKDTLTQQSNPDSALAIFKRNHVTHMLIASLRINPAKNTGNVINTLHNIAAPIMQKYPQKLVMVKQIGISEPAYLYEIKY